MDGSSIGNPGEAGIGGVLRDSSSKVLGMFSKFVGTCDSIIAELCAIHRTVSLVASSNSLFDKEVDFISDSKKAIDWINAEGIGSLCHMQLISSIRDLAQSLGNVRIVFNSRASNFLVDSLAKKGARQ